MVTRRRVVSISLAVLAGGALAVGGLAGYARSQLVDEQAFSARLASALDDEAVRRVVAERAVDALVETASADLLVVRPLLQSGLEALAATEPFQRLFAIAAADAHRAIVSGESSVILDLDRAGVLLLDALRGLSPRVAEQVPDDVEPVLAGLHVGDVELGAARRLKDLAAGWWWGWIAGGLLAGALAILVALERRTGLSRVAAAAAAGSALLAGAVVAAGELVATHAAGAADLDDADERAALGAVWAAMFGDLLSSALVGVVAALAVSLVAARVLTPAHLRHGLRRVREAVAAPGPWPAAARGAALLAVGAGALLEPRAVGRALVLAAGAVAVFLGVAEIAGALERRVPRRRVVRPSRAPVLAGAGAVAVVAVCVLLVVELVDVPRLAPPSPARASAGCNGSPLLCERRLNEIVLPATHNSFAAADERGWLFANQRFGIARQLEDGIRALLLDVHYGIRDDASQHIRTDLEAEGSSRNRVARELSPEALTTADRLVGRIGLGDLRGERGLYLCHTLCELGAEPLHEQLLVIRRFLEANRSEVLVLFMEPYVPATEIERALDAAGLLRHAARLPREAPLPTLGELVAADTRLVVLTEDGGGTLPWYLPGFSFAQDTPLGARRPSELSCARSRGTADSPLLLINHWIDDFPPTPSRNARIAGAFLRDRLDRCARERAIPGAIVAVDFYDRSGVIRVAREANRRGRRP